MLLIIIKEEHLLLKIKEIGIIINEVHVNY